MTVGVEISRVRVHDLVCEGNEGAQSVSKAFSRITVSAL
jgi:hypothetical protein